jgi:transposase
MSVPDVGPIVTLTFTSAIDDPARSTASKRVGPYFGSRKYQSGETDIDGRISQIGDASARANLYEAANVILTKLLKGCTALKSWATRLARRAGPNKAKVALARKLAFIMHRMLVDGPRFRDAATA